MEYVNTDAQERVWPDIQRADGATLELQAGETVELELPEDFEDPYLKPVVPAKAKRTAKRDKQADQADPAEEAQASEQASEGADQDADPAAGDEKKE